MKTRNSRKNLLRGLEFKVENPPSESLKELVLAQMPYHTILIGYSRKNPSILCSIFIRKMHEITKIDEFKIEDAIKQLANDGEIEMGPSKKGKKRRSFAQRTMRLANHVQIIDGVKVD